MALPGCQSLEEVCIFIKSSRTKTVLCLFSVDCIYVLVNLSVKIMTPSASEVVGSMCRACRNMVLNPEKRNGFIQLLYQASLIERL